MNLTIRASSGGLRGMFGVIEGVTGVTGSGVVVPAGVMVGARVATAGGGVATGTASAGVAGVGAGVVIEVADLCGAESSLLAVPVWLLKLPAVLESLMAVPVWLLKLPSVLESLMATTSGISMRRPRQR